MEYDMDIQEFSCDGYNMDIEEISCFYWNIWIQRSFLVFNGI